MKLAGQISKVDSVLVAVKSFAGFPETWQLGDAVPLVIQILPSLRRVVASLTVDVVPCAVVNLVHLADGVFDLLFSRWWRGAHSGVVFWLQI